MIQGESVMKPDVLKAMRYAELKHIGQKRDSGMDFFEGHCMVVYKLIKMRRGSAEILCASLLHDTLEDTDTTYADLEHEFGYKVAMLVKLLTHTEENIFPYLKFNNGVCSNALVDMAMVIKHADTYANVREMYSWTPEMRMVYHNKKTCWRTE